MHNFGDLISIHETVFSFCDFNEASKKNYSQQMYSMWKTLYEHQTEYMLVKHCVFSRKASRFIGDGDTTIFTSRNTKNCQLCYKIQLANCYSSGINLTSKINKIGHKIEMQISELCLWELIQYGKIIKYYSIQIS